MSIYTIKGGQSFDAEMIRLELVAAIGEGDWYINTAGNQFEFVGTDERAESVILAHFDNGAKRAEAKRLADIDAKRSAAYTAEADPLYFKQQRGEVPAGTWEAKVAEIRVRIPK